MLLPRMRHQQKRNKKRHLPRLRRNQKMQLPLKVPRLSAVKVHLQQQQRLPPLMLLLVMSLLVMPLLVMPLLVMPLLMERKKRKKRALLLNNKLNKEHVVDICSV